MKKTIEYVFHPDVQKILDHFCGLFGIRIIFHAAAGGEVRVGQAKPSCRYCELLLDKLGYKETCNALNRVKRAEAAEAGDLVAYECHGGMTEAMMPVHSGDCLIGFVMVGQFRSGRHKACPARVKAAWRARHGTAELESAFQETPYIPADKLDHLLNMFRFLVAYIVAQQLVQARTGNRLAPVLAYLREHVDRPVSLGELAALCRRSPTTISHLFKASFGRGFKQIQIEMKMDRAERHLRSAPGMTVREAAFKLGYRDPFYFSRLFKKHKGYPPSACVGKKA
ncbi:MAG: PocR ligand-binding domain-containing protein [Kiritimatiellae bacterium]|nr:PocR ligand-binding domain-containing protein [Kiritimatiellia bacterium]